MGGQVCHQGEKATRERAETVGTTAEKTRERGAKNTETGPADCCPIVMIVHATDYCPIVMIVYAILCYQATTNNTV